MSYMLLIIEKAGVREERSEAEAQRAFDALAAGGEVTVPLGKTFWSPCFGMLKDRFGLGWMVSLADNGGSR